MRRLFAVATIAVVAHLAVDLAAAAPPGQGDAFNFSLGGFFPTGDGDFWTTNEDYYTLDHSDFNGLIGNFGYTASITNYFEVDANAQFYATSTQSADRYYVDVDGYPILHDSRLAMFPLLVGFRVLPAGRFTRRGADGKHYVRRPVPYIGGGVGMNYWQYEEEGDFVAFDDSIVYDRFTDSGLAFQMYAMIGIEFPVAPQWNITLEVRQSWADATPSNTFPGGSSGTLDLGGTSVFLGGSLRF